MAENKRIDQPTGTRTVGHEWDGIEELDTPMPRWWLLTFYATIFFAIAYMVVYPALPGLSGATTPTERLALVEVLTQEAWALAGWALPTYARHEAPVSTRPLRSGTPPAQP